MKKIIVVGGGRWGTNHIRTLIQLNCFGGVVEPYPKSQERLRSQFPDIIIFNDIAESLKSNPDGYTVATPPETHFDIGCEIINNHKPVLIEKPLTLDYQTSKKLVHLANESNVNLMVGHVLLFHPAIQKIKALIEDDKIGELKYLYSNRLNLGTIRSSEDVFWSLAPHDISIFQYFINSYPEKINSFSHCYIQENINDITIANFEYQNNIKAHIFTSWANPFKEHKLVVVGSKGMIVFEDSSNDKDILLYDEYYDNDKSMGSINVIKKEPVIIDYERSMPLTNELKYFIDNLDATIDIANGNSGLEVIKILESI